MISSESNTQIKNLIKLQKNARHRRKCKCFTVEGIKLAMEAAACGKLQKIYISETLYRQQWNGMAERELSAVFHGAVAEIVSDAVFAQISDTITPQGILGIATMPEYSLEDILASDKKLFLLLDDIRDPGNLGTMLRTGEGAGMSGVILSKGSVDLFNPKVVRATMGAIFRVPFVYVEDLPQVIREMKEQGISIYGTYMEGSVIYDSIDYRQPSGIVVGNEANGISDHVAKKLTKRIRIPMEGKLESLNAAVAAAVVMYEAARQRRR